MLKSYFIKSLPMNNDNNFLAATTKFCTNLSIAKIEQEPSKGKECIQKTMHFD